MHRIKQPLPRGLASLVPPISRALGGGSYRRNSISIMYIDDFIFLKKSRKNAPNGTYQTQMQEVLCNRLTMNCRHGPQEQRDVMPPMRHWDLNCEILSQMLQDRQAAGLTQAQMAERLGTKPPAVTRLEASRVVASIRRLLPLLRKYAEAVGASRSASVRARARSNPLSPWLSRDRRPLRAEVLPCSLLPDTPPACRSHPRWSYSALTYPMLWTPQI